MNLTQTQFLALRIPLPSIYAQNETVREVERHLSIVDEIEAQVSSNTKRAARLRQGILKRAFEGRLVPHDPTDEPAERLLERIRQQRLMGPATSPERPRCLSRQRRDEPVGSEMPLFEGTRDGSRKGGMP